MDSGLTTFFTVFLFVFIAELADKTQLLILFLSGRYHRNATFWGVLFSSALLMAIVVFPVEFIRNNIPIFYIKLISASLLIIFGIIGFIKKPDETDSGIKVKTFNIPPFLLVATTFFIAEMGDRTQLAGLSFALKYNKLFFVWLGAWLGLFLANLPIILAGKFIMKKIKPKYLHYFGSSLFLIFGIVVLIEVIVG